MKVNLLLLTMSVKNAILGHRNTTCGLDLTSDDQMSQKPKCLVNSQLGIGIQNTAGNSQSNKEVAESLREA